MSTEFFDTKWGWAGKYGRSSPWYLGEHWVRDGDDLLKLYDGEEAIRVFPTGDARLTIAKDRSVTWYKQIGRMFDIDKIREIKSLTAQNVFCVHYRLDRHNITVKKHQGLTIEGISIRSSISSPYQWNCLINENIRRESINHAASRKYIKELREELKIYETSVRILGLNTWKEISDYVGDPKKLSVAERVKMIQELDFTNYLKIGGPTMGNYSSGLYKLGTPSTLTKNFMRAFNEHKAEIFRQKGFI